MTSSLRLLYRILVGLFVLFLIAAVAPYAVARNTKMDQYSARQIVERARVNKMNLTKDDLNDYVLKAREMHIADLQYEERDLLEICCSTKYVQPAWLCMLARTYAHELSDKGSTIRARKYLDKAIKLDPDYSIAYALYAEMTLVDGDTKTALEKCKRGLLCTNPDRSVFHWYANILVTEKKPLEALKMLEQAEKRSPPLTGEMLRVKGSLLENLGRYDEAIAAYRESQRVQNKDWAAFQIVNCLDTQKKYGAAIAELDKLISLNPRDAEAFRHRANMKIKNKDYKGALKDLNTTIDMEPTSGSYKSRAKLHTMMGHADLAKKDLKEAENILNGPGMF